MNIQKRNSHVDEEAFRKAAGRGIRFLPLYLFVPVLFWLGFGWAGYWADWRAFGLGALGWVIALVLRGPVSVLVHKLPKDKGGAIAVISSGVLEEPTRLVLLLITSQSAGWAISLGQGWAAVEVAFTMINILVIASLAGKTDEKSMQAKQMLAAQGNLTASPLYGIVERISASAFHIGATLIAAAVPWMIVVLVPLHSGLNWGAVKLAGTSVKRTEAFVAAVGLITLAAGILLI
jgi:hypothetical protein